MRLLGEAVDKCPVLHTLVGILRNRFLMPSPSYFLVAGAQRRELESALATVWDALEREVNGLNNLRLATRILVEELGMAPTDDVGQLVT